MRSAAIAPVLLVGALMLVASPAAIAGTAAFDDTLGELETLLAAGDPLPHEVEVALGLLETAANEPGAELARPLLRHLAEQLRPLATRSPRLDEERRRESIRRAQVTARLLRQKLDALGSRRFAGLDSAPQEAPSNDACASATVLSWGRTSGNTIGATNDGGASCGASAGAPDVWYSFTATADSVVVWDTFDSSLDTVLSLHSACPDAGGDHELACSDDARGTTSSLVFREMSAGETVLVRVSGAAGATGSFDLVTDPTRGGLAGTVTKAGTGEPIAGAEVLLTDTGGFHLDTTETAEDGSYLFTSSGFFYVLARHPGFVTSLWRDVQCLGATCPIREEGELVTVDSNIVRDIDFHLEPGATIEGTIVDGDTGSTLFSGIQAIAYDADGATAGTSTGFSGSGHYQIRGLPAGAYTVRTNSAEYFGELYDDLPCHPSCDVTGGVPVPVTAGSTTPDVDFVVRRLGSLRGQLTSARDGSPIASKFVELFDATGGWVGHGFTGPDGTYTLRRLAPGEYFLRSLVLGFSNLLYKDVPCEPFCDVTVGTPIPVALATETRGIDFSLEEFGRIAGFISGSDTGAAVEATIRVFDAAGQSLASVVASGAYELRGFAPGSYFVRASRPIFLGGYEGQLYQDIGCQPGCDVTTGTPVTTSLSTTTTGIDFVLDRCSYSSHRAFTDFVIDFELTIGACRTVQVENVTVTSTGELLIEAGETVVFGSGFSVEPGGRLEVVVHPDVGRL